MTDEIARRMEQKIEEQKDLIRQLQATLAEREASYDRMRDNWSTAMQDAARLRMLIFRLLNDLPTKRDWLDPDIEKTLKGA